MKGLHSFEHQHGLTLTWSKGRWGLNRLASAAGTKSIMADDGDEFTAECTCLPNARHTLAHFECHSSHRGLAFGVDSPGPGADSYPCPQEADSQGTNHTRTNKEAHNWMILFTVKLVMRCVFRVWLLFKRHYNSVWGHWSTLFPPLHLPVVAVLDDLWCRLSWENTQI